MSVMSRTRPRADHRAVAAACHAAPGVWVRVAEYNSSQSARATARDIRNAYGAYAAAYSPAGTFDARWILTEMGARVEARFTNGVDTDTAWADAVASLAGGAA